MTIMPSLGLVRGADAALTLLDGTAIDGATGEILESGEVTITYPLSVTGAVLVTVFGDADAEYFDEATGTFIAFPEGSTLRAALAAPQREVGVTALTELAASLLTDLAAATAADVAAANERIRQALAGDLTDITLPPRLVSDSAPAFADSAADRYAAILAAIAQLGEGRDAPALSAITQLRLDLTDDVLDGLASGDAIADLIYDPAAFADAFRAALATVVAGTDLADLSFTLDFADLLAAAAPDDSTGGGDMGGGGTLEGNATLTITGTASTLGVSVAFGPITINSIPAPDASNITEIEQAVASTVGEIGTISSVAVTVVTNTASQLVFTVQFSASVGGLTSTYDLTYDYSLAP